MDKIHAIEPTNSDRGIQPAVADVIGNEVIEDSEVFFNWC